MQMIPSADAIGQTERDAVQGNGRAHVRDARGLHPCGDTRQGVWFWIGGLENENRKVRAKWTICSPEPFATSKNYARNRDCAVSQAHIGGYRSSSSRAPRNSKL
jgi:hypothetical protein